MSWYEEYLASEGWQKKRQKIMDRADGTCEDCGRRDATQVHHKTYERLGRERMGDLIAVCGGCHIQRHSDKELANAWVYRIDHPCPACGTDEADMHLGGRAAYFICTICGNNWKVERRRESGRAKSTERPEYEGVPCEFCTRVLANKTGLSQHMEAKHPAMEFDYIHYASR